MQKAPFQRVRLAEIALQANCTVATVSMALNGSSRLPDATKERIQSIAKDLGYLPNRLARSLSMGRSGILGVIVPFSIDPYYAALLDSLHQEASDRSYQLHIQFHRWSLEEEEKAVRRMIELHVDGILLYRARSDYAGSLIEEWLDAAGIPLVMLRDVYNPPKLRRGIAGTIRKDYEQEGILLTKELFRLGHRHIDILEMAPKEAYLGRGRYEGACEASADYPDAKIQYVLKASEPTEGEKSTISQTGLSLANYEGRLDTSVKRYLSEPRSGTAVLTSNSKVAWKLLGGMRRLGLQCPDDLSVVSVGTLGSGSEGSLTLTAVEYNSSEIAFLAIEALLRCLSEHSCITGEMLVRPTLVIRESTGAPPALGRRRARRAQAAAS